MTAGSDVGRVMAVDDTSWMQAARCRDMPPDWFFPSDGTGVRAAQLVCERCPVRERCLAFALDHHIEFGVWGGASERARRRLARTRRAGAPGVPGEHR